MKDRFDFDGVLKDLLQRDRPALLEQLAGGVKIKAFLNVELHRVLERRVDLAILLEDGAILHVELQSTNDARMRFRMVSYWGLLKEAHNRPVRQVILYVGRRKLTMRDRVEEDGNSLFFGLIDIRSFDAGRMMNSQNPADLALAVLAGGGDANLAGILKRAARLRGARRARVLAQILVLAGLRGVAAQVEWKMKELGMVIDVAKNSVLMKWRREAVSEGRAEMLRDLMGSKFGPLPKWAADRIAKASPAQLERWGKKMLVAENIEAVLGKR